MCVLHSMYFSREHVCPDSEHSSKVHNSWIHHCLVKECCASWLSCSDIQKHKRTDVLTAAAIAKASARLLVPVPKLMPLCNNMPSDRNSPVLKRPHQAQMPAADAPGLPRAATSKENKCHSQA